MEKFLQTLIDALAVGSLYALIALGYTMVYGILKFINFAHSDVFVLGAWTSFLVAVAAGWGDPQASAGAGREWVAWVLWAATIAAAVIAAFEYAAWKRRHPTDAFSLNRTRLAGSLVLVAAWGWAALGLAKMAGVVKAWGDNGLFSGLLILLCAMATCGLVGFVLERLAYKPLRKAPRLNVLITAIGVSLLLQNLGQLQAMFGTRPQRMPTLLPTDAPLATIANVKIMPVDVIGAATAVALMFLLDFLVHRTKFGRSMRAVSFNPTTASLMGIPVDRVISVTFVIGASLAAAAGFLYGQKYPGLNQTAAAVWVLLGLKAFVAAVVGGIGNIRGAMLGGVLIGLLEFFGAAYVSAAMRDVYVFSLLIVVLLVRPSGILGRPMVEKV
ncbi:MAG: branched-chain amino acid ABC transporter permease [Phycisphaerae bacterium]|nr:branched-chain amino acid ABC transporter permease [Phycisphaerae bacterium]